MSNSLITKSALARSLKACMQDTPLDKVSIQEVCSRCGLNRKSFYYHFRDKYELVNWIYETEINSTVQQQVKNRSNWDIAMEICNYIYANRVFYLNALEVSGPHSFYEYFCRSLEPFIQNSLDIEDDDTLEISEISDLIGDICLCSVRRWLTKEEPEKPELFLEKLIAVTTALGGKFLDYFLSDITP